MNDIEYHGSRTDTGCVVKINGRRPLSLRLDLYNHSPTGFGWGYAGSGPAQLALALLAHALGARTKTARERVLRLYQPFKFAVVACLPGPGWVLRRSHIEAWAAADEAERGRLSAQMTDEDFGDDEDDFGDDDVACFLCGCTESFACPGGCYWDDAAQVHDDLVDKEVCTACVAIFLDIKRASPHLTAKELVRAAQQRLEESDGG